jgi:hypothetical protein
MLNRFQAKAVEVYQGGDFAWLKESKDWRKDVDDIGDGLLRFILVELSEREDCSTWEEALARMETAMIDLELVRGSLVEGWCEHKVKEVAA